MLRLSAVLQMLFDEYIPVPKHVEMYEAGVTDGSQPVVVMLVESLGDVEKSWADDLAAADVGVIVMVGGTVFTGSNVTADFMSAWSFLGSMFSGQQPPVVGFGMYALHAMLLSYSQWVTALSQLSLLNMVACCSGCSCNECSPCSPADCCGNQSRLVG